MLTIRDSKDLAEALQSQRAHAVEASRLFARSDEIEELAKFGRIVKRELPGGDVLLAVEKTVADGFDERSIAAETRTVTDVIASDETVDSFGDIIEVGGWDLARFKKNPAMTVDHDHRVSALVGFWSQMKKGEKRGERALLGDAQFLPPGDAAADMAFPKILGRALRSVSVAFRSFRHERIDDEEGNFTGFRFKKQELLAVDWVVVPANPNALAAYEPSEGKSDNDAGTAMVARTALTKATALAMLSRF